MANTIDQSGLAMATPRPRSGMPTCGSVSATFHANGAYANFQSSALPWGTQPPRDRLRV